MTEAASNPDDVLPSPLCTRCGGKCCRIYQAFPRGSRPPSRHPIAQREFIHGSSQDYGIKPSFDAVAAWGRGGRAVRRALSRAGIDPRCCEYLGPDGCLVERGRRAAICLRWYCNALARDLGLPLYSPPDATP